MARRKSKTESVSCVVCGCPLNYGQRFYMGNPYKPRAVCQRCLMSVNTGRRDIPHYMITKKRRFDNVDEEWLEH